MIIRLTRLIGAAVLCLLFAGCADDSPPAPSPPAAIQVVDGVVIAAKPLTKKTFAIEYTGLAIGNQTCTDAVANMTALLADQGASQVPTRKAADIGIVVDKETLWCVAGDFDTADIQISRKEASQAYAFRYDDGSAKDQIMAWLLSSQLISPAK